MEGMNYNINIRFVVVCGDGEYIIYTALAWRNKSFGNALDFVWALDSNEYAIRESSSKVRIFKSFKEKNVEIRFSFSSEAIHGGALLGIRSSGFLTFFDWETGSCVRRIDVVAKNVFWSESDLVVIACEESFYVLKFNRLAFQAALDRSGGFLPEGEGVEDALEVVSEINEVVKTGTWVGDCFIYTTSINRLNYIVGGQVSTIYHFDSPMYVLGYIARDNRIYLSDKDINVLSFSLPLTLVEYQTAVLRGDLEAADSILPSISVDQRERVARFLEGQGMFFYLNIRTIGTVTRRFQ
jgi:coatomer subunit beta'